MARNDSKRQRKRPPHPGEAERIAQRRLRVLELRIGGRSYREIGRALGVNASTVCKDLAAERVQNEALRAEAREDERALDLARLDTAIQGLTKAVKKGIPKAVISYIRCLDRRAKLLGLDAPTRLAGPTGGPIEVVQLYMPDNGRSRTGEGGGA